MFCLQKSVSNLHHGITCPWITLQIYTELLTLSATQKNCAMAHATQYAHTHKLRDWQRNTAIIKSKKTFRHTYPPSYVPSICTSCSIFQMYLLIRFCARHVCCHSVSIIRVIYSHTTTAPHTSICCQPITHCHLTPSHPTVMSSYRERWNHPDAVHKVSYILLHLCIITFSCEVSHATSPRLT